MSAPMFFSLSATAVAIIVFWTFLIAIVAAIYHLVVAINRHFGGPVE